MDTTTQHDKPRLLSDAPSAEDVFGSHQRVADAIAEIIRNEHGGKSIGIEGGWGSGKSTIINLLQKALKTDQSTATVAFDAWVHEGDPLRRAFIETLIVRLQAANWINQKQWASERDKLAKRKKVIERTTTPKLTNFGKLLGVSALLIPFGVVLFSAALKLVPRNIIFEGVSAALTLSPLIVIIGIVIYAWVKKLPIDDFWALVVQKNIISEHSEITENPEPTSIEFKEIFSQLMVEALGNKKRKLVIVVDNLDRVPPDEARVIWSVLRSFLEFSEVERPEWYERLWVVIPYDSEGLKAMLNMPSSESNNKTVATSFLDKVLQVRFYTAPPVLSDWRKYLTGLLQSALPSTKKDGGQVHSVYRLYAIRREATGHRPTPRDLILYVNEIGALYRQWQHQIPIHHMAYYVLLRRDGVPIIEDLLTGMIPKDDEKPVLGDNLDTSLAALFFNVPPDHAQEVLLKAPLTKALGQAQHEILQQLATQHAGFAAFLENEISKLVDEWTPSESRTYSNAARALVHSGILDGLTISERRNISQGFTKGLSRISEWNPFDPDVADGIICLLTLNADKAVVANAIKSIEFTPHQFLARNTKLANDALAKWVDALVMIIRELKRIGHIDDVKRPFEIPCDPQLWLLACERLFQQDPSGETYPWIAPTIQADIIGDSIAAAIKEGKISRSHTLAIAHPQPDQKNVIYDKVAPAIEARLVRPEVLPGAEIAQLIKTVVALSNYTPTYKDLPQRLVRTGIVLHLLHAAFHPQNEEAIAWLIYVFLKENPTAAQTPPIHNAQAGFNFLQKIFNEPEPHKVLTTKFLDILDEHNQLELIFKILDSAPQTKKWITVCIKQLEEQKRITKIFNYDTLIARWPYLKEVFDRHYRTGLLDVIVENLVQTDALIDKQLAQPFDPDKAWLYSSIARTGAATNKQYINWIQEGLFSVNHDDWLKALEGEADIAELVVDIGMNGPNQLDLGVDYLDALVTHGQKLVTGQAKIAYLAKNWQYLISALSTSRRQMLRARLRDAAEDANGSVSSQFFDAYGEELKEFTSLMDDRRFVSNLLTPFVTTKNLRGLIWTAELFETNGNFLERYQPQYAVQDYKDRLGIVMKEPIDDTLREAISRIVAKMELTLIATQPHEETK